MATKEEMNQRMFAAVQSGDIDALQDCIYKGEDVNCQEYYGETPLHKAAVNDRTEIVDLLLKSGASPSVVNYLDQTPLHWAALYGRTEVVDLLLKSGASPSVVDKMGQTPLHRAAEEHKTEVVDLLLKLGASPSVVDKKGLTPLHEAAGSGRTEVVDLLLKSGASQSVVNNEGWTPLHWAARNGRTEVVDFLIKSGASLSVVDKMGQTPLHEAAGSGRTEVVELLLKLGASPSVVDKKKRTPYDVAAYGRTKDFLQENSTLDYQFRMMDSSDEMKKLLSEGTFLSYENCVYLGGACNVGKTTLASILIGEEIPQHWKSTDGLTIYFGRNGINLKTKEMVPLKKGSKGGVLSKVLRGKPNIPQEKPDTTPSENREEVKPDKTQSKNKEEEKPDTTQSKNKEEAKPDTTQSKNKEEAKPDTTQSKNKEEVKSDTTLSKNSEDVQPQDYNKENIIKDIALSTGAAPNPTPGTGKDDVNITHPIGQQSQEKYNMTTFQEKIQNVKEEIRKGTYKMEIAPSDLVDFGGQRSFDMTHQLFMRYKGTFVLMFNGQIDFSVPLKEYKEGESTEAILKHWVNSILSYCVDDEDILPKIMFCATHRDAVDQKNHEERRKKLIHGLVEMFKNHKLQHRIIYDDIFFINGMDENDHEINRLKSKLVEVAFEQESWGKQTPMALVPLDLQMSELRLHNMNIISKEELITLNRRNEDLALTDKQIKHFLNVQHSFGKILYFDQLGLDNFIIVQPQSLVNILRSFITGELFWPEDKVLRGILCTLTETGEIAKKDLLKLWSQEKFHQHMPNDDFKEFIIQVLVHLDILVEPKHYRQQKQESKDQSYLVPCIVKRKLPDTDFYDKADKMICLSYTLLKSSIPAALSFKLIGAAMNIWPITKTREGICLYHQAAILCIDESNDLHLLVEDDKVFVYLINKVNKYSIPPNVAFRVQVCLTFAMTKVLEFYHESFGKSLSRSEVSKTFDREIGEWCTPGRGCYISISEVKEKTEWICKNKKKHNKTCPRYWIFYTEKVICDENCSDLTNNLMSHPKDTHLFRLAERIDVDACTSLLDNLGLPLTTWKKIQHMYKYNINVAQFYALCKWKEKMHKEHLHPSFQQLSDALPADIDTHVLCQVLKEDETGNPTIAQRKIPEVDVLKELSRKLGNCAIHLGVELGLDMATITETVQRCGNSTFEATFDVMKKWQESNEDRTIHKLMKALKLADGTGFQYLENKYGVMGM